MGHYPDREGSREVMMGLISERQPDARVAEQPSAGELFQRHAAFVWRTLRHLGVREADLEDVTQEVFVVVHNRLNGYDERDKVRSWLYAICSRIAKAYVRKVSRRRESVTVDAPEFEAPATQLEDIEKREALARGQRILASLPEEQRAVFLLFEVERMPMVEVAEAVGCPLQTAYSRLHKARERVLGMLDRAQRREQAR
jgi:RNA polymerase sigma-70 factor, ECF subfamily